MTRNETLHYFMSFGAEFAEAEPYRTRTCPNRRQPTSNSGSPDPLLPAYLKIIRGSLTKLQLSYKSDGKQERPNLKFNLSSYMLA